MVKVLSILHRCIQDELLSHMISVRIKEKENTHLIQCVRDHELITSDEIRMQIHISDLYVEYVKSLANFVCVCQLLSIRLQDLLTYSRNLKVTELFKIMSMIDQLIEQILIIFEERNFCARYRIF